MEHENINALAFDNVVNGVNWGEIDILCSTPMILNSVLELKQKRGLMDINPKIIVIDEMDLLLGDKNLF